MLTPQWQKDNGVEKKNNQFGYVIVVLLAKSLPKVSVGSQEITV